ncbi:hypothetical protein [Catenulispora pinisilvae]|nr:hypothetical protein [Catenulispora pinisilvae]
MATFTRNGHSVLLAFGAGILHADALPMASARPEALETLAKAA